MLITGDGFVKLTDFGIARDAAEHTITGARVVPGVTGQPRPEIASGAPAGPASDAWSLGGTLYACVEGSPPFHKGTRSTPSLPWSTTPFHLIHTPPRSVPPSPACW